jgi:type VI secretion system secreted protein VgrG
VLRLTPGFSFQLDEHPRADLCKKYLLTRVRHVGFESGARDIQVGAPAWLGEALDARETYRCEIEAVDAATRWAPRATTPWPRIGGSLRARVDGPIDSAYAQIDEHGRYLVRLLLDESDLPAGGASTRIRMLQPHSGNPEGLHLPLRKDTEVQIVFLKGDPDQPVIAGVVPNKLTASPVTASNKSQNVLQTGGLNRVEMEDQEGSEYIDLSTVPQKTFAHLGAHAGLGSHNYVFSTDGDYAMHTGGNRDIRVGGKQTERVDGNVDEKYHADQTTHVFGALDETIDAGAQQKIHAGSTQTIDGGATQTISGGETRSVTGGQTESIDGGRTQSISGSSTETISGSLDQTVTGAIDITINGGQVVVASGGFELNTPAMVTLTAAGGFNLLAPGGQTRIDEDFNQFGREYTILAPNQFVKTANRIDLRALYLEGVVVKVDIFGVKRTVGASQKSTAAAYLGAGGCYTWKGAMFKRSAALQSVGG